MNFLVVMVLVGAAMASPALAQDAAPDRAARASTIEGSLRYVVASTKSQTRYQIDVLRVDSTVVPVPDNFRLPVIYVLDGNSLLPLVSHMVNVHTSFSKALPAVLVVSIGYPSDPALSRADDIKDHLARRMRDLSPAAALAKPTPTLVGHSLGGLFTVYAFLNAPNAFSRYIAASPSLFWDEHALIKQAGTPSACAARAPTRLFIAVGGLETKERMGQDMIGDARNMVAVLQQQNIPGLDVSFYLFPDENHISVIPAALMRGLREVGALR